MCPLPLWDIISNSSHTDLYDIYARLESTFLAVNDTLESPATLRRFRYNRDFNDRDFAEISVKMCPMPLWDIIWNSSQTDL